MKNLLLFQFMMSLESLNICKNGEMQEQDSSRLVWLESRGKPQYKRKHNKGWFHAYREILEKVGLDLTECPADLELIEQAVLARNRGQHPDALTMLQTTHSKSDLEKYPNPYFVSETDQRIIEADNGELSWWLSPNVYVDEAKLSTVISEVEKLCEWLEEEYLNAVRA